MISFWPRVNRQASDWLIAVILTSHWLQGDFAQFHKLLQEGASSSNIVQELQELEGLSHEEHERMLACMVLRYGVDMGMLA